MAKSKYNSFGRDRAIARAKKKAAKELEDAAVDKPKTVKKATAPNLDWEPMNDKKIDQVEFKIDWSDESTQTHSEQLISSFDKELMRFLKMPTGTGKTAVVVAALGKLQKQAGEQLPFVVTAPTAVINGLGWQRTIKSYNDAQPDNQLNPLLVTSVDKFANALAHRPTFLKIVKALGQNGMLVLDEAHKYKNPTSKRSKTLQKLQAFRKIALSATPLTNDVVMDSASYLIMGGYYNNKTDFMNKSDLVNHIGQFGELMIYNRDGHINDLIWPYYHSLLKEWSKILYAPDIDVKDLDMPNMHTKLIQLPHSDDLTADMKSLSHAYRSRMFDSYIDMYMEYVERLHNDDTRIKALTKILDDPKTKQPLIFYVNEVVKDSIVKVLEDRKQEYQVVSGGNSFRDVDLDKDCPILVQYYSGAEGIEMKNSNTTIYYQNQSSYMILTQARGRNVRRGMTHDVYQYHLIADEPIDQKIFDWAFSREEVSESMIQDIVEKTMKESK